MANYTGFLPQTKATLKHGVPFGDNTTRTFTKYVDLSQVLTTHPAFATTDTLSLWKAPAGAIIEAVAIENLDALSADITALNVGDTADADRHVAATALTKDAITLGATKYAQSTPIDVVLQIATTDTATLSGRVAVTFQVTDMRSPVRAVLPMANDL